MSRVQDSLHGDDRAALRLGAGRREDHKHTSSTGGYVAFDAVGCTAWTIIVTSIGYWFGTRIKNLDHYILLAVVLAMIFTLGPTLYHIGKALLSRNKQVTTKKDR